MLHVLEPLWRWATETALEFSVVECEDEAQQQALERAEAGFGDRYGMSEAEFDLVRRYFYERKVAGSRRIVHCAAESLFEVWRSNVRGARNT